MADLLDALDAPGAAKTRPVDEIWALDCVLQGDSAILNEPVIGNTCQLTCWCILPPAHSSNVEQSPGPTTAEIS